MIKDVMFLLYLILFLKNLIDAYINLFRNISDLRCNNCQ